MKNQIAKTIVILATLTAGLTAHAIPNFAKPNVPEVQQDENLLHKVNRFPELDTRQDLRDTKNPWSTVGRLVTPGGGLCSGTLIGADLVLTAAHCILDKDNKLKHGTYQFQVAYARGQMLASAGVLRVWYGSRQGHYTDNDWALLQLNARLGDRFGWMGVRYTDSDTLANNTDTLYLNAYGSDYQNMEVPYWQKGCRFRSRVQQVEFVLHDCSSSRGSSGGGMFVWDNTRQGFYIVAVNVAERRSGEVSETVPYSHDKANVAIPTHRFFNTLKDLLGRQTGA